MKINNLHMNGNKEFQNVKLWNRKICHGRGSNRSVRSVSRKVDEEAGMMVVEALLSFTIFVMAVAAIVYLITIFMLHNRIQFALNSAAHELAAYSYIYQALGIRSGFETIEQDGSTYTGAIDDTAAQLVDTLNQIETLQGSAAEVQSGVSALSSDEIQSAMGELTDNLNVTADSAKESYSKVVSLFSEPDDLIVGIIYMAASAGERALESQVATLAAEGMTKKYLSVGEISADDYLKNMGVCDGYGGLDFAGSTMFCDSERRMIDFVVEYDVDLSFVRLLIPDAKLHMVQRVSVAGWLDGDGRTLDEYGVSKK